ncbi:hypothetical protein FRC10_004248 [Ceratobasidium sp. 414]|nr:hypothetical protein FRC10_004248 [Ceratobasidium sp. 414]
MSRRYLGHMSVRISDGANNLVRLWARKVELVGEEAFDASEDLRLAVMVSKSCKSTRRVAMILYVSVTTIPYLILIDCLSMKMLVSITTGDSLSSVDAAYASLPTSASSLSLNTISIRIPQSDPSALQKALRVVMESIERLQFTAFLVFISKVFIQTLVPSWRNSYSTISQFLDSKVLEARTREAEISKLK